MGIFKCLLPVVALASVAASSPFLAPRQSATTCGSTSYSESTVADAANAACGYVSDGSEAGSSDYPHQYENYEGFDFPVSSPWYEFPLVKRGPYDGGSPGPDRVIINGDCQYAGAITHTGASGDDFVGCSGTS